LKKKRRKTKKKKKRKKHEEDEEENKEKIAETPEERMARDMREELEKTKKVKQQFSAAGEAFDRARVDRDRGDINVKNKSGYNSKYDDKPPTEKEMEDYLREKNAELDPMAKFLSKK